MPRVVPDAPPPRSLLALILSVVLAYAVVLPTGFIDYDDSWLIADNPLLRDASPRALGRVWAAFDLRTRLILGAEYLPVRDTVAWLIARAAGPAPWAFHAAQLAAYLGAVALLRAWLRRVLSDLWVAELAVWLFALHPAHVSSVAWAAGLKDALSLLFVSAALRVYAAERARPVAVAVLVALACLSKGTSVVAPALLIAGDVLTRRSPRWPSVALASLVVAGSLWAQARVGAVVQMIAEPLGRNVMERITSMAPAAVRYLGQAFLLERPCMVRVVPVRTASDPAGLLSLAILALLPLAAWRRWRAGDRLPAVALWVFVVGLAPVSQVLVPLQNRMADRYLLFAVLGPCLLAASLLRRVSRPALRASVAAAVLIASAAMTAEHAWEFADPERLWRDAMVRVPESPVAPYQLALRREARGARSEAEALYREVLRRDAMRGDLTPRAAVNLSRILVGTGRAAEAEAMLRAVVERFPAHPRPINNLATLLYARGETEGARALFLRLAQRFPDYPRGRANYESRFGPLPGASWRPPADGWTFDPYTH